jgi:hypothetical protein
MWRNVTWINVKNDRSIETIEHPILNNFYVCKEEFEKEFAPVVAYLDAQTLCDCVDFFFQRGFPNRSCLQFVGEDERADFYDWAVELGCCLSLKETHEGESEEEKLKRKIDEENRLLAVKRQKEKQQQRKNSVTPEEKDRRKILSMYKNLSNPKLQAKEAKYKKTKDRFEMEYKMYQQRYGKEIVGIG